MPGRITIALSLVAIGGASLAAGEAPTEQGESPLILSWLIDHGPAMGATLLVGLLVWLGLRATLAAIFKRTRLVPEVARIVFRTLRWTMLLVIILVMLQQVGVELGMVWGFLSATLAMVAIGFVAVWSVLSNTSCAAILLMSRPFRIGDTIEIIEATGGEGLKGRLIDINLMFTTLQEQGGTGTPCIVRVPNNVLLQKTVRVIPGSERVDLGEHMAHHSHQRLATVTPSPG